MSEASLTWAGLQHEEVCRFEMGHPRLFGDYEGFKNATFGRPAHFLDVFRLYAFEATVSALPGNAVARVRGSALDTFMSGVPIGLGVGELQYENAPTLTHKMAIEGQDVYVPLYTPAQGSYGHWPIDLLPVATTVRRLLPNSNVKLLYADYLPPFAQEIAQLFGFSSEHFTWVGALDTTKPFIFAVTTPVRKHDYYNVGIFQKHYQPMVKDLVDGYQRNATRKLFVSGRLARTGLNTRALTNRLAVERLFESAGYDVIESEKLSAEEKVKVYGSADVIAGEAGSGVHNSIFMKRGGQVLYLNSSRQNHLLQASLSHVLGQPCTVVVGQAENSEWGSNFSVELDDVHRAIESLKA